jgi:hypothetical protein
LPRSCARTNPSRRILFEPTLAQCGQCLSDLTSLVDLVASDQAEEKEIADGFSCPMPAESIAPSASRQTVARILCATLISLDHVVHFPVPSQIARPPTLLEYDGVTTEVTMAVGPIEDASEFPFSHGHGALSDEGRVGVAIHSSKCFS